VPSRGLETNIVIPIPALLVGAQRLGGPIHGLWLDREREASNVGGSDFWISGWLKTSRTGEKFAVVIRVLVVLFAIVLE
jgi:hypothetical protein